MADTIGGNVRTMRWGIFFALLTLVYGFGLGAAFGAAEESIKGHLDVKGRAVLETTYGGDEAKLDKVTGKAWTYFKRAHLHANGLGTTALVLIALLAFLPGRVRFRALAAAFLGIGGLGYGLFWMLAALQAPGLGSTGAAKDSLEFLAIASSGLCILGLLLTIQAFVAKAFGSEPA